MLKLKAQRSQDAFMNTQSLAQKLASGFHTQRTINATFNNNNDSRTRCESNDNLQMSVRLPLNRIGMQNQSQDLMMTTISGLQSNARNKSKHQTYLTNSTKQDSATINHQLMSTKSPRERYNEADEFDYFVEEQRSSLQSGIYESNQSNRQNKVIVIDKSQQNFCSTSNLKALRSSQKQLFQKSQSSPLEE